MKYCNRPTIYCTYVILKVYRKSKIKTWNRYIHNSLSSNLKLLKYFLFGIEWSLDIRNNENPTWQQTSDSSVSIKKVGSICKRISAKRVIGATWIFLYMYFFPLRPFWLCNAHIVISDIRVVLINLEAVQATNYIVYRFDRDRSLRTVFFPINYFSIEMHTSCVFRGTKSISKFHGYRSSLSLRHGEADPIPLDLWTDLSAAYLGLFRTAENEARTIPRALSLPRIDNYSRFRVLVTPSTCPHCCEKPLTNNEKGLGRLIAVGIVIKRTWGCIAKATWRRPR